jgi:Uma2 family endonuclease
MIAAFLPRSSRFVEQSPEEVWPEWLVPPEEGYFAEDLDRLPGLPPRTELIDGSLVFVSPQSLWHGSVTHTVNAGLMAALPPEWHSIAGFTVRLGPRDRPEPDVLVAASSALADDHTTWVAARDVKLVVEVESAESRIRDREVKYAKYADAGIEHYWRVVRDTERRSLPVTHLYELGQNGRYHQVGQQWGRVMAHLPFMVDIDLADPN